MKKIKLLTMVMAVAVCAMALVGCGGKSKGGSSKKYDNPKLMKMLDYRTSDEMFEAMGNDYSDEKYNGRYCAEYSHPTVDGKEYTSIMVFFDKKYGDNTLKKVEYLAYGWTEEECKSVFEDLNKKYGEPEDYDFDSMFNTWKFYDENGKYLGMVSMEKNEGKGDTYIVYFTVMYSTR